MLNIIRTVNDKVLHVLLGLAFTVEIVIAYFIYLFAGAGWAILFHTIFFNAGYEVNQWFRKEGEPSIKDALAGSVSGVLLAICLIYYQV